MNIRAATNEIKKQINLLNRKKQKIQAVCPHPNVVKKEFRNGEYEIYYNEFSCPDCEKFWSEEVEEVKQLKV